MTLEEMSRGYVGFDRAPGSAIWVAQDIDGCWYWFCNGKPVAVAGRGWVCGAGTFQVFAGEGHSNTMWMNTLQHRSEF